MCSGAQSWTLTISEKTLHLLTRLIVVDEDVEAEALETFEQLTSVSVGAVPYIHPCQDTLLSLACMWQI